MISTETIAWVNNNMIVGLEKATRFASRESRDFRTADIFVKLVSNTGETRMVRWDKLAEQVFVVDITANSIVSVHSDIDINNKEGNQ